jgi:hypothetical protein
VCDTIQLTYADRGVQGTESIKAGTRSTVIHGRSVLPVLRADSTGMLPVALEDAEHDDAVRSELVNDSVALNDDLANIVASQLGNAAPRTRHPSHCALTSCRCCPRRSAARCAVPPASPRLASYSAEFSRGERRRRGRKIGGGGGNRTRVRKHSTWSHYMLSPCFSSSGGRPRATCPRTIPEWISSGAVRAPRRTSRLF